MRGPARSPRRQSGVSLVSAVFVIVVLAGLAVLAVRIGVLQQQSVNSSLLSAQAFHAARSGAAWASHRAINGGWCATQTLALTEGGASGFSVDISCVQSAHAEGASTINVYVIDVLAERGTYGGPDYVSRRLQIKVTDAT